MLSIHPDQVQNSGRQYIPNSNSAAANCSPNQELLPLTARINDKDCLEIGGCDVTTLVQQFGTPLYILDEESLRTACRQYREAFKRYYAGQSQVLYASKAWNCLAVCAIAHSEGLGIDVVSGGELYTALQAGVNPNLIYLHGNNKSIEELNLAIESGCTIVVDNWHELRTLASLAAGETGGQGDKGTRGQGDKGKSSTTLPPSPCHPLPPSSSRHSLLATHYSYHAAPDSWDRLSYPRLYSHGAFR